MGHSLVSENNNKKYISRFFLGFYFRFFIYIRTQNRRRAVIVFRDRVPRPRPTRTAPALRTHRNNHTECSGIGAWIFFFHNTPDDRGRSFYGAAGGCTNEIEISVLRTPFRNALYVNGARVLYADAPRSTIINNATR